MEKNKKRFITSVFVQDIFAIPLARAFIFLRVNPNLITIFGLCIAVSSCYFFLYSNPIIGSLLFFLSLILDSTDGRVARGLNKFSKFGAQLDSASDKLRSFIVSFIIIYANTYSLLSLMLIYIYIQMLPLYRYFIHDYSRDERDPIEVLWYKTKYREWLESKNLVGLYNGWERAVIVCVIAPLTSYPIAIILIAVFVEQLLFMTGKSFMQSSKL